MKGSASGISSVESTVALRRFFGWLESKYGGMIFDPAPHVITSKSSSIHGKDLLRLMQHDATIYHVKKFYPKEAALELGRQLAEESETKCRNWKVSTSRGLESSDVSTLGVHPPFNIASSLGQQEDYFDGVIREFQIRRFGSDKTSGTNNKIPSLWPLDLLRLQLDEAWPSGAGLAHDPSNGKPFSGGLPRVMKGPTRWKKGFIHVDEMGPLNPQSGLFSANIYLQLPDTNTGTGEGSNASVTSTTDAQDMLYIWPLGIRNRWDWYRNALSLSGLSSQDAEDQVRLRHVLGEPIAIACEPGDLVMLCVQRPHAAVGFSRGTRVSLQCFIQHKGPKERLEIDT